MNEIDLSTLELKTFTEQDVSDYCFINNINSDNITYLSLGHNKLIDISGIKLFKNLEILYLGYNKIENISVLKYLNKLKILYLFDNKVKDVSVIQYLKNLQYLIISNNEIEDISVLKYLKKLKTLDIKDLELESDQIKYIQSLNKLKELWCNNGFKNMSVINKLNKNIIIRK